MPTRIALVLSLLLILAATLTGVLLWDRLPDPMASHWDAHDQVDGYISRLWGVLLMPLAALGTLGLFLLIPIIDPLKSNIAQFRGVFNSFTVLFLVFLAYLQGLTLAWNLGYRNFKMGAALLPALGALLIFMGYLLRRARRNWFIGIRTPWTLSSDRVWNETHRLASALFAASGVLTILASFLGGTIAFWVVLASLIGSALFLAIYSYALYQRETRA